MRHSQHPAALGKIPLVVIRRRHKAVEGFQPPQLIRRDDKMRDIYISSLQYPSRGYAERKIGKCAPTPRLRTKGTIHSQGENLGDELQKAMVRLFSVLAFLRTALICSCTGEPVISLSLTPHASHRTRALVKTRPTDNSLSGRRRHVIQKRPIQKNAHHAPSRKTDRPQGRNMRPRGRGPSQQKRRELPCREDLSFGMFTNDIPCQAHRPSARSAAPPCPAPGPSGWRPAAWAADICRWPPPARPPRRAGCRKRRPR